MLGELKAELQTHSVEPLSLNSHGFDKSILVSFLDVLTVLSSTAIRTVPGQYDSASKIV